MAVDESTPPATSVDDQTTEVALALLAHLEDQINRSDTKAQVVLAADAILLGWFGTLNPGALQTLLGGHSSATAQATSVLVVLVFVALFLSLACGLGVIWPRAAARGKSSLVYFGGIARYSESAFVAAFLRQSSEEVTRSILAGVHAEARIAQFKFRWVSLSVAFLLATLVVVAALALVRLALP